MSLNVSVSNFEPIQHVNLMILFNWNMYLPAKVQIRSPIITERLPKLPMLSKLFTAQSFWINASNSPFHFIVDFEEIWCLQYITASYSV